MSAQAFIAFLKCEATQAEERAKNLRATAAAIEANAGQEEVAKKKRKRDPNKPKRSHTAYTMFVQENYEMIKKNHDPNVPSKDIISIVARQWANTSEEEKLMWKERAQAHKETQAATDEIVAGEVHEMLETEAPEELETEDKEKGKKRRATKKAANVASV